MNYLPQKPIRQSMNNDTVIKIFQQKPEPKVEPKPDVIASKIEVEFKEVIERIESTGQDSLAGPRSTINEPEIIKEVAKVEEETTISNPHKYLSAFQIAKLKIV